MAISIISEIKVAIKGDGAIAFLKINDRILKKQQSHSKKQRSHSKKKRSQLISNQTTIAYFLRHAKCSKRSPSHSINQRSQLTSNQTAIANFTTR
ncbi:MAG: hypothetical protein DCF20_05290 [Pseudanabaena sp.]|nr:MAG: hypothetical protein DCF20_05290 [Pseudanabaena sp.]